MNLKLGKSLGQGCSCMCEAAGTKGETCFLPKAAVLCSSYTAAEMLQGCRHCLSEEQGDMGIGV